MTEHRASPPSAATTARAAPPRPTGHTDAARWIAWLFVISGLLAVVGAVLTPQGAAMTASQRTAALTLGGADVLVGVLAAVLPWRRWHPRATLVLAGAGLAIMAGFAIESVTAASTHTAFLVLVFVWLGVYHPLRWSFAMALPAAAAYALGLDIGGYASEDVDGVVVVVVVALLVAGTVSRAVTGHRRAELVAAERARLLSIVAAAGRSIGRRDPRDVAQQVLVAVSELGFELGVLARLDGERLEVVAADGVDPAVGAALTARGSITAMVQEKTGAVVMSGPELELLDVSELSGDMPARLIAAPVWGDEWITGALVAADGREEAFSPGEVEAVELLAQQASQAMSTAHALQSERAERRRQADAALRDDLTTLPNRRAGEAMLRELGPGDAVALLDLDHFKQVNDQHGHAAGDAVLTQLGAFLGSALRDRDHVARFGGEEFIVVVRDARIAAPAIIGRLLAQWRAQDPVTTLSAGLAWHEAGADPAATLAAADRALYRAKRGGRDRLEVAGADVAGG